MPKTSRELMEHGSGKERTSKELEDLRRKLDNIEWTTAGTRSVHFSE
ncbi:MAG: hypothetical protein KDC00_14910 [Flavobacteriales bacterium]|nr:hypothetical protein [Flavobacteriales bacterium]